MELRRLSRQQPISINPKIAAVMPEWMEDYRNNHLPNTVRDCKNVLPHLVPFFGGFYFSELTPLLIEQYKRKRLETQIIPKRRKGENEEAYEKRKKAQTRTISKRTIEKELAYLSSFLTWAAEHHHCSPIPFKIKKFPKNQTTAPLARPLHLEELTGIIDAIEPEYLPILLLMTDLGLRRNEALKLKDPDVNLVTGQVYVLGKGNKERVLPITTDRLRAALTTAKARVIELRKELKAAKIEPTDYLFINPKSGQPWYSIRKAILRAAVAAGIDRRVYHHLLRHTFGTQAMSSRLGLRTVQSLMGHATAKTTELYTQLAGTLMEEEASRFNDFISRPRKAKKDED